MQSIHVLVDLENNQPTLEDVQRLVPGVTHAWLFHSRSQVKRLASFAPLGAEQTPVPISRPGKNALDFHLAFYVGYIAARNPGARLVIVAIDRGYQPLIEHAVSLGFDVTQVPFKPGAAPAKKAAGRKTAARKAPAAKAPAKKAAEAAQAPVAKAPKVPKVAKVPTAKTAAAKTAVAKAAVAKAPVAKKVPAKQTLAKKAAAKKVTAATQPAARKTKAAGAVPQVERVEPPARKAAPARPQAQPQRQLTQSPMPEPKPPAKPQRKAQPLPTPRPEPGQQPKQQPKQQPRPQPKAPAPQRAPGKPPAAEKVLANLRTMGEKQPKKLRQLRRYVSSMLGTGEADPAVGRLVDHLVDIGYVRVNGEAIAYAAPGAGRPRGA